MLPVIDGAELYGLQEEFAALVWVFKKRLIISKKGTDLCRCKIERGIKNLMENSCEQNMI